MRNVPDLTAPLAFGTRAMARIDALAIHTDVPGQLHRLFLSPAHRACADAVAQMMRDAGFDHVHIDALGTVVGRYAGEMDDQLPLILGSHLDSVKDAGRYDGPLGVVAGIGVVESLWAEGRRLPCPIEVMAFGDEENVRFPTNLASSRAVAGTFDPAWLNVPGEDGETLAAALRRFGGDPEAVAALARPKGSILGYLEMHIEQGPVLEVADLPVGVVTAIASIARARVTVSGMAGHAGTVPMGLRQDALACGAEMIGAIERIAMGMAGAVATVGQLAVEPGAINVIPGRVVFSVDARAPDDPTRQDLMAAIRLSCTQIAARRGLTCEITEFFDARACPCDPRVMAALDSAIGAAGFRVQHLASGAGHDAMAMAAIGPVGMLFVRCKDGISHHPAESITLADCDAAMRVFRAAVDTYAYAATGT